MAENTKKQDLATGAELTLEEKINKIKSREITEAEKGMLTLPAFEAACEAVKKSEKLLRFTLDDGTGTDRQILSGIHKWYKPEELVGKTLVAIVNLPPRKMMGLESCGMLLSAVHTEKGEEVLNLIMVDDKIPAGAKLC